MNEQVPTSYSPPQNHGRAIWIAVIGACALVAIGGTLYQGSQTETLRRQVAASQQDNDALRAKLLESDTDLQKALATLRQDLSDTKEEANSSVTKAARAAARHADLLAEKEKQAAQQLSDELNQVKQSSDQTSAKLDGVTNDVGSVKTDLGSIHTDVNTAKTNIQDTSNELQRVKGDMGVMSGLVATNGKEIQMLRDLGDRNIYEFTISRNQGLQKVGNIQIGLRKSDMKRNRYTVDVLADDKKVAKTDKGINEPVQFYVSGGRQPYEIVVNTVSKDQITGYLATPKVTLSRVAASNPQQ
jgi:DNA repair exonuclease SbcCD ATPase subunit